MIRLRAASLRSARLGKPAALVLLSLLAIHASGMMKLRVCASSSAFDIHEHLSTKAPYIHRVRVQGAPSVYDVPDPAGYKPLFMYLLARHGSRWPTEKRMRQINSLKHVFRAAATEDPALAWMHNWTSPMAHIPYLAGELHPEGEAELMGLAQRLRGRFPALAAERYAPRRHPIISTQVPRAAQSASAFALGFFDQTAQVKQQQQQQQHQHSGGSSSSGEGIQPNSSRSSTFGWRPQPVAINMLPKKHDPVLRFFECCKGYRQHEDMALRWLGPWMHSHWRRVVPGLEARMGIKPNTLNSCHVDALWQLCTFEAGLMNTQMHKLWLEQQQQQQQQQKGSSSGSISSACQMFMQEDAVLLEWLEDVRLYETQGYGAQVNYAIAAPLLADIASALTSAATAHSAGKAPLQQVRLMFAHCETLAPLASLIGLFTPGSEEQREFPKVPSEQGLKSAVKISNEQVEADLAEVEEVAEDLPLVVMQQQQQQPQGESTSEVGSSSGGAESANAAHAAAARVTSSQQLQHEQQQQQGQHILSAAKRRRLSKSHSEHHSSSSISSASVLPAASQPAHMPQGIPNQKQQQLGVKHQHGPEVTGCSYKGGAPIDSTLLLPPPHGWLPRFLQTDGDRVWRGGRIAPLGANLVLVLYGQDGGSSSSNGGGSSGSGGVSSDLGLSDYRVRLVYNEQVLPVPGCSSRNDLDCSLKEWLEVVVGDKISREKVEQFCSGTQREGLESPVNNAADNGHGAYSSSSSSLGSFSSQDPFLLSRDWGGASFASDLLGMHDGVRGLEFVTADGLPLLLPVGEEGDELQLPVTWY